MSADSTKRTITVALGVCLVCSIMVSSAAVFLKSTQENNKKLDKLKNILSAAGLYENESNAEQIYNEKIEAKIVDLETGKYYKTENPMLNPTEFDIKSVADDPELGEAIPADRDRAQIKRMPKYMTIYEVRDDSTLTEIIFPIYGKGLWSTMYGFMALGSDLKTVKGFTFYEHGETPGLGGEVDNPNWKKSWIGKQAFNSEGDVIIDVIKGKVDPDSPNADHQIDGLSGSTMTTRGVDNLVRFWLSDMGYGPYLDNLRKGGLNE